MPIWIVQLLLKPTTWLIVSLAILAAACGVQTARLSHSKHDLAAVRDQLAVARADSSRLQASVQVQNAAVAALKVQGDRRQQAAQAAVQAAQEASRRVPARVVTIMQAKPQGEPCKAADDLILGALQ